MKTECKHSMPLNADPPCTQCALSAALALAKENEEHAQMLDDNWATLHNAGMNAIREALKSSDATVPEMVGAIAALRADLERWKEMAHMALGAANTGEDLRRIREKFALAPAEQREKAGDVLERSFGALPDFPEGSEEPGIDDPDSLRRSGEALPVGLVAVGGDAANGSASHEEPDQLHTGTSPATQAEVCPDCGMDPYDPKWKRVVCQHTKPLNPAAQAEDECERVAREWFEEHQWRTNADYLDRLAALLRAQRDEAHREGWEACKRQAVQATVDWLQLSHLREAIRTLARPAPSLGPIEECSENHYNPESNAPTQCPKCKRWYGCASAPSGGGK